MLQLTWGKRKAFMVFVQWKSYKLGSHINWILSTKKLGKNVCRNKMSSWKTMPPLPLTFSMTLTFDLESPKVGKGQVLLMANHPVKFEGSSTKHVHLGKRLVSWQTNTQADHAKTIWHKNQLAVVCNFCTKALCSGLVTGARL